MDKKSRKIIAAIVAGLMLVMSFAEVPAVFAAENDEELQVETELENEQENDEAPVAEIGEQEEPEIDPEVMTEDEEDQETPDGDASDITLDEGEEPAPEEEQDVPGPVDPSDYPNGDPLVIGDTTIFPRLYIRESLNDKYYDNYNGNIKVLLDVRWFEGLNTSDRVEDKYNALVEQGWQFKYSLVTIDGTVVADGLTYDEIGGIDSEGVILNVAKGKQYYIWVTATHEPAKEGDPPQVEHASSLKRTIKFTFPGKPKSVKATCAKGSNTMKITYKAPSKDVEYDYCVYRGKSSKTPLGWTKNSHALKWSDKNLAGPKSYYYFVRTMFKVSTGGNHIWVVGSKSSTVKGKVKGYFINGSVRPIAWKAKVNYDATIYSSSSCSSSIGSVSKGTKVYVLAKSPKKIPQAAHPSKFQIEVRKNGKVVKKGWVKYGPVKKVTAEVAYKSRHAYDYSKETKERFVNKKKYSSSTKYLCWVNTYTQRVNIFKGKKGKWKLYKSYRVTSGTFYHLTTLSKNQKIHRRMGVRTRHFVAGVHKLSPSTYYMKWLSFFTKGNSFHSHCWRTGSNRQINHVKGNLQPGTKGCMRMSVANAKWIYNNIPMRTRVVTY